MDDANMGRTTSGSAIQPGVADFTPSSKTQDTVAAPADSHPISILLWHLKYLYSL